MTATKQEQTLLHRILSPESRCMPLDTTEILESFKKKKKKSHPLLFGTRHFLFMFSHNFTHLRVPALLINSSF